MQFSLRDILIEWKKDQGLRFGRVDEGETSFGIKQSPLIYMTKDFDEKSLQEVLAYLESQTLPAEVQRLVELLKKKKDAEN
ncbi:MAG: hypothetical protein NZM25_00470 [Leptospiraceae bacterium]|nr:hypothetical protein [Leptospiraceae bacterium]MDW8306198.1 hypothetical protein [Leptospiraceae bacterium]